MGLEVLMIFLVDLLEDIISNEKNSNRICPI